MQGSPLDVQIAGVLNDGTDEGLVRATTRGPLVTVPFEYITVDTNGTSGGYDAGGASGVSSENPDGYCSMIQLNTSAGIANNKYVRHRFYGPTYGLSFNVHTLDVPLAVEIDGECFQLDKTSNVKWIDGTSFSTTAERPENVLVVDNLPDTAHIARISLIGSAAGTSVQLFGFVADARYYRPHRKVNQIIGTTALSATQTALTVGSGGRQIKACRKILYHNLDSATRTVTIQWNSVTIKTISIASGASAEFDPGDYLLVGGSVLKHAVDAITTTAPVYALIGGI